MVTTNLSIPELDGLSTSNPGAQFNSALDYIDALLTEAVSILVPAENEYTISSAEFLSGIFFNVDENAGSPATADLTVYCPAVKRGAFVVINLTAFNVTVEISGQSETSPVVASGSFAILDCDGTDVRDSLQLGDYFVPGVFVGVPGAAAVVVRHKFIESVTFPSGLTDAQGACDIAPTSAVTLPIYKNSDQVGTVNFAGAATTATFTFSTAQTFDVGDEMVVLAPTVQDATFADFLFTFVGTYAADA